MTQKEVVYLLIADAYILQQVAVISLATLENKCNE